MRLIPGRGHRNRAAQPSSHPGGRLKSTGARGALAVGASLAAGALTLGAFAAPAGATLTGPANTTIVGSGSSTTFYMMQDMDTLFNQSPGCTEYVAFPSASTPQPLDYSCTDGVTTSGQQTTQSGVANAIPENPFNDVSVQEQPLGSSNGIAQLEDQGTHGAGATSGGVSINVADNVAYARSSRALKSSDLQGLNFVAYAQDGVSWFHYTKINASTDTPSNAVTNLTQAQLEDIWNGTDTNWDQVGGTKANIVVFSAQEGSGTQSTWDTFLGFDPSAATNAVNCYTPPKSTKTCVGPAVIFENEDAQIQPSAFTTSQKGYVDNNSYWGASKTATIQQIKKDAIFFFSYGKYSVQCKVAATDCGGSPLKGFTNALGSVNGIAPTETTILEGTFPVDRYLYNVYSNGSNSNLVTANAATLNYVSEIGFICNPNKGLSTAAVDMNTGKTYISEIQNVIEENGFFPLSAGGATGTVNQTEIDEGHVGHPASTLLAGSGGTNGLYGYSDYAPYDTFATNTNTGDPEGFCLTTTTDGNSTS
jgi:ABC-type phosphate transport system substrate-binding protein